MEGRLPHLEIIHLPEISKKQCKFCSQRKTIIVSTSVCIQGTCTGSEYEHVNI